MTTMLGRIGTARGHCTPSYGTPIAVPDTYRTENANA